MKLGISLLFCLVLSVPFAKDPVHKIFGSHASIILKANSVKIYKIEKYPIVSAEQEQKELYIYDYGVTRTYSYDRTPLMDSLNTFLMDTTQFLHDDQRTCPFVGKYAVEFTRGKKTMTLIFSEKPCYKMIIFCPGTEIDKMHLDLGENNQIYDALVLLATDKM